MNTATPTPAEHTVVIGGGSGIGAATAVHLAARGRPVTCLDRDLAAASAAADYIRERNGASESGFADVSDEQTVRDAFDHAARALGPIRAVINTAGVQGPLGLRSHEIDPDDFDRVVRVNLRGALVVSRVALSHMLPRGYGRIVHVASIAGKEGNPGMVAYSATKAGLIGMVKSQGKEYATDGVTINALAPAVIRTPFLDSQPQEVLDYMLEKIPMRRAGSVEEAAAMLEWITSPECSFTTGFTFDLSGGRATY